jgi:hypothetical protein
MRLRQDDRPIAEPQSWCEEVCPPDGKCKMCGRTAAKHGVTLIARSNLWVGDVGGGHSCRSALCVDCSRGLRAYFHSLGARSDLLRKISCYESVHVRIGELLKATGTGKRTPSSLICSIAGQRSWKSRLRELRQSPFDWELAPLRYKAPSGRVRCDYVLIRYKPWPAKKNP